MIEKLFIPYQFISLITFFVLSYNDWQETTGVIAFLTCVIINGFLAEIWPIYWGILHWMF